MSKNLTRKGLAFGALVALGASVFAGTPAFAADTMVLAANYSTDATLAAPVTEAFSLNAALDPNSNASNISSLTYKIVTDGTFTVGASISGAKLSSIVSTANVATVEATSASNGDSVYTKSTPLTAGIVAGTGTAGVFGASGSVRTSSYLRPYTAPSSSAANVLTLKLDSVPATDGTTGAAIAETTPTKTVTVVAFLDGNNNGLLEAGETQKSVDVKFVKFSEITTSSEITAPVEGDKSVTALVKFTNVNAQALTPGKVGAYFTKGDGTALGSTFDVTALSVATTTATATAANDLLAGDTVITAGLAPAEYVKTATVTGTPTSSAFTYTVSTGAAITDGVGTAARTDNAAGRGNVALVAGTATYRGQTAVTYSTTLGGFKFVTGAVNALVKATAVKVQPLFDSSALTTAQNTDITQTIGSAQTASVTARALGSFVGTHVLSTSAASATASASASNDVALNTEKQVYFIAKDTATVPAAKAGQAVSVTVSLGSGNAAALSATSGITLTVNGTTYSTNASLPGATGVAKLALTTGADGKVVITYKTAGFTAGDTVVFTALAENYTAVVTGTERTRVFDINDKTTDATTTANDWAAGTSYFANSQGVVGVTESGATAVAHYTETLATTDGTAAVLNVVVQDQFGGAPADGTFVVTATFDSSITGYSAQATTAATSTSSTNAAVVGGKANLSILDNGTGKGTNTYKIELYRANTNGVLSGNTLLGNLKVKITDAADIVPGEVVLSGATSKSTTTGIYSITGNNYGSATATYDEELVYSAFKSVDRRAVANTAPSNYELNGTDPVNNVATVSGTVNSASTATYGGVAVPNASVTVSGAGMQFKAALNGGDVYGDGTLTFPAKSDGTFTVYVWGNKAGKQLVTVKSGAGSAQFYVYFKAARQASASAVTVKVADGAAQFQAGRALDVTVTVTDKFGNPVQLTGAASGTNFAAGTTGKLVLTQTGSGYLSATSATTDETGSYATKLITNAGDLGTSTITAKVDFDNTTGDLTDVVKAVSSEFGVTDADVTVGGRAVYASVEFAKGKTVTVSVDGKRLYSKLQSSDAYTELKFTQKTAGKHVVTVRVSGGIVYSETVVTTK